MEGAPVGTTDTEGIMLTDGVDEGVSDGTALGTSDGATSWKVKDDVSVIRRALAGTTACNITSLVSATSTPEEGG